MVTRSSRDRFIDVMTKRVTGRIVLSGYRGLSRLGQLHPLARPERHGVRVTRDVAYTASGEVHHTLDVYQPVASDGPVPAMLYVHGGGFRILSKDTHWALALGFARHGICVFNINYRLAPEHPFPAGLQDAATALAWVIANAADYGADVSRLLLAGESAGANLVTSLTLAACDPRPEPWARAIYDLAPSIVGLLPACGLFQVNDMARFGFSGLIGGRMQTIERDYLEAATGPTDLADPLRLCEAASGFARPFPPSFLVAGGRVVIRDDAVRMGRALQRLGVDAETVMYPGGIHAFHALVWTAVARQAWRDQYRFIDRVLGA